MSFIYEAGKSADGKRRGGKRRMVAPTRRRCESCG